MVQPKGSALAILIVDDEANIRKMLSVCLETEGHMVTAVGNSEDALAEASRRSFDVAFVGGSTAWKLGPEAKSLIAAAKARGKGVHVGRVNSQRRFLAFAALGCDSADGTYLAFGPDENLPKLLGWLEHDRTHAPLFEIGA